MSISPEKPEATSEPGDARRPMHLAAHIVGPGTVERLEALGYKTTQTDSGHLRVERDPGVESAQQPPVDPAEAGAPDAPK